MVEFWCGCVPRLQPRFGTIILAAVSFHSLSWHWSPYLEALEIATAVRVFANMLWGFVIVNIIIAIIIVVNLVQNRQYEIDNCIQFLQKQSSVDTSQQNDICTHRETTLIVRNVAIAILLILFSVLFARVSSVYAQKLELRIKNSRRHPPTTLGTVASISTTDIPIR
ncbi:16911_t:CDS:2 [Dentiscutata erythropus]|uniref:16911_t:CDS:1 n=1 Tax=Dentiscutata erythropus TaxID=1348616 RepID=A0A9N8WFP2_9GLOM|nr:16911_t:CDS:2 [Dentiscutata erythropus]